MQLRFCVDDGRVVAQSLLQHIPKILNGVSAGRGKSSPPGPLYCRCFPAAAHLIQMDGSLMVVCRPGRRAGGDQVIRIRCVVAGKRPRHAGQRPSRTGIARPWVRVWILALSSWNMPVISGKKKKKPGRSVYSGQLTSFLEHITLLNVDVKNCSNPRS